MPLLFMASSPFGQAKSCPPPFRSPSGIFRTWLMWVTSPSFTAVSCPRWTSSPLARPAKTSRQRMATAKAWRALVPASLWRQSELSKKCEVQPMENTHATPYSKTSQAHSAAPKGATSSKSSKRSAASKTVIPLFLNLQRENGQKPDSSWEMGIPSRIGLSRQICGECPSVVVESSLSQILEAAAPEKYCLSARACSGILNRAARRGKALPPMLREALEAKVRESETAPSQF